MTMTFFFKVTDTGKHVKLPSVHAELVLIFFSGSWLEIGQTISFFCVASLLLVWSAGICAIGEVLMGETVSQQPIKEKID